MPHMRDMPRTLLDTSFPADLRHYAYDAAATLLPPLSLMLLRRFSPFSPLLIARCHADDVATASTLPCYAFATRLMMLPRRYRCRYLLLLPIRHAAFIDITLRAIII